MLPRGKTFRDFRKLLKNAHKLLTVFKDVFRTTSVTHVTRIPTCRGYFQREEDAKIKEKLRILCKPKHYSCVKTLLLYGDTGHGKTYSAANAVKNIQTARISGAISVSSTRRKSLYILKRPMVKWTLNAVNESELLDSYCSLAEKIGLAEEAKVAKQELALLSRTSVGRQYHSHMKHHASGSAHHEALKRIYKEVMTKLRLQGSWVLLVDNASHLNTFWPHPGDDSYGAGLVVLTTQNAKLLSTEGGDSSLEKVCVGSMSDNDAVGLLMSKSGVSLPISSSEKRYATEIAVDQLFGNPQDISALGTKKRELEEDNKRTISFKEIAETGKFNDLSELMLTLEMVNKHQTELFKFLACCSSEPLPLQILENNTSDKEAIEMTMSEFVDVSERDGTKVISMHLRNYDILRNILTRPEPKLETERNFLGYFRSSTDKLERPKLSAADVSKVIRCLSKISKDALQSRRDNDLVMIRMICPHLKEAMAFAKELNVENDLEPLVMADGHACLGESLLFFGESEDAKNNLELALKLYEQYDGPENVQLDLANVLHFLGETYSYRHLANPQKGEEYLRKALDVKERLYQGLAHPQVAFTLRSLGDVLNELGNQLEAIKYIKRALEIYDKSENEDDLSQEYGYTLSALGSAYRYLGQYVEAENCLKKALNIFRRVKSPSKLRMGLTLSRLASVQRSLDKLDESIRSLNEAQEKFGNNEVYSAVILSKLSVVHRYKGESNLSLDYATKAKEITEGYYGRSQCHPAIATARLNLGHAESDLGDVEMAERNLNSALVMYRALHGENHRIVAATLNYVAYAYQRMGRVYEGKEKLERAVKIMHENYSSTHPEKANSLKRLSKVCLILGETVRSIEFGERALDIYKKTFGNTMDNREVRKCSVRVGYAYSKLGLFKEAKECLKEVRLGFPQERKAHPEFASVLSKSTEIVLDSLEIKRSLNKEDVSKLLSEAENLQTARDLLRGSLGGEHLQFAATTKELARVYLRLGRNDDAYDEVLCALRIVQKACRCYTGVGHFLEADISLIRSDIEMALNLDRPRLESLQRAEKIYRNVFGDDHPSVAVTLHKLCRRFLKMRNLGEANKYFEASRNTWESIKTELTRQLESSNEPSYYLKNYNIDLHPIFKEQQLIEQELSKRLGEW